MDQNYASFLVNPFIQAGTKPNSNNRCNTFKKGRVHNVEVKHIPPQITHDSLLNFLVPSNIPKPEIKLSRKPNSTASKANLYFKKKEDAKLTVDRINLSNIQGNQLKAKLTVYYNNNNNNYRRNVKKLQVTSPLVLQYIENILMLQKPSELNNVNFKFKKDALILLVEGQNFKSAAKWVSKEMEECHHVVIYTDANTEQKISAFKAAALDKCCTYSAVITISGVKVHFVIHKKNYAILEKYLTRCLSLEDNRINVRCAEIKAVKKRKHKSGTSSNSPFPKKDKVNKDSRNLIQSSHPGIFFNVGSS